MSISQQRPQEIEALVTITEILTGPLRFSEKCQAVMVVLADFTGSDLVTLREFDPDNFTLNLVASYSRLIPPRDMKILLSISSSLSARALDLQIPVAANDYPASEMRNQGYVDSGVKSALTLPVQVEGETLGTLGFASRSLNHYQEDTVRVLSAIGAVVRDDANKCRAPSRQRGGSKYRPYRDFGFGRPRCF